MKFPRLLVALPLLLALFVSCDSSDPYDPYRTVPPAFDIAGKQKVTLPNGLIYYVVQEGTGEETVQLRSTVDIYYTGRFTNNRVFDSSYLYGSLLPSQQYLPNLVKGFNYGAVGMKVGEKRKVIIPPALGYGDIPGHQYERDTLVFDLELDFILPQKVVPEN